MASLWLIQPHEILCLFNFISPVTRTFALVLLNQSSVSPTILPCRCGKSSPSSATNGLEPENNSKNNVIYRIVDHIDNLFLCILNSLCLLSSILCMIVTLCRSQCVFTCRNCRLLSAQPKTLWCQPGIWSPGAFIWYSTTYNADKTIINHPNFTINRWYKPFPNGWFIIVFPT